MPPVEFESEFRVFAIDDGTVDFLLRLSRLVTELNVVELSKRRFSRDGVTVVDLGVRVSAVNKHWFDADAKAPGITMEYEQVV
ncbi:hypothetical protein [Stratiformator vulcanicus]|uniref:Uncharacterized protein n=1 Tax=Stratiformator vulcanicus TaxID=2527980 RepID=A0A517R278_9PLAN|nr:hypothetical protein [Stratiformator vulcanicus]QDT37986.1 hypothetical protein Pan189_23700 [Stratiformator vulcanicus]